MSKLTNVLVCLSNFLRFNLPQPRQTIPLSENFETNLAVKREITLRNSLKLDATALFRHEKISLSAYNQKVSIRQICFEILYINFTLKVSAC